MADTKCTKCQKDLDGMTSYYDEKPYHPDCFVCHLCHKPLAGEIRDSLEGIAHKECFEAQQGYSAGEGDICHACRHDLNAESGPCVVVGRYKYHDECFVCSDCKCSLAGMKYKTANNRKYCMECY